MSSTSATVTHEWIELDTAMAEFDYLNGYYQMH